MRVDELGVASGDQHVAGERDLEAGGDGEPGDRADDGLAAALHLGDGVGRVVLDVALEDLFRRREVDAGAEGAAAAGENDGSHRRVVVEAAERAGEGHHHGTGERVEGLGPVDGDEGDARGVALHQNQILRRGRVHLIDGQR